MVFTHRMLRALDLNRREIDPKAGRTALSAKIVPKTRLGVDSGRVGLALERHLADFCSLLVGSWPLLGASWASLGHFSDALGCLLAALWSFNAGCWVPGLPQASLLPGLGRSQTEF